MDGERKDVYGVYDKIADWYHQNRYQGLMERGYLERLVLGLEKGSSILDLGCGTGIPIYRYFIEQGFGVTGVDASRKMLEIARQNFPRGYFVLQDMRHLSLDGTYDAVIAWHSFFHLPQDDQRSMFPVFAQLLRSGGFLVFTSGTEEGEAWAENGGANLFHASLGVEEYSRLLSLNRFRIILNKIDDPECGGATVWVTEKL